MAQRAYRIAYDGTGYYGFQRQPDVPTVEDAIFDALRALEVLELDARKPTGYAAAGRTDAGVSALAQTIALEGPDWLTPRALNAELPADIRAWASAEVDAQFHATHDATRREYTYHLHAPATETAAVETERAVDDDRFRTACEALSGQHEVRNLTPDDEHTVRDLDLAVDRDGPFLVVTVTAPGFSRELVRRVISLVHDVGTGVESLETIDRVLSAESLPGHEGIAPAPPEPLVLTDVTYPGVSFEVDPDAVSSARAVFSEHRRKRLTGARVAGTIAADLECR